MPIIGMTRRVDVQDATHRLVMGELNKGGPKVEKVSANGKKYQTYGPDLDHWRFTSERVEVLAAWNTAILAPWNAAHKRDGKVTEVEAYLPFAKLEQNWATWFEEYDHGGMIHRCDGQTMTRWRKPNGAYADGAKPCPYHAGTIERTPAKPGCTQVGRLYLVLPALVRAGPTGLVTMHTKSINDLVTITAQLVDAEDKARGDLRGILFTVYRYKDEISTPAWKDEDKAAGKRNRVIKDLVGIAPAQDWVMARLELAARKQMALAAGERLQLTTGNLDADDFVEAEYTDADANRADAESIARAAAEAATLNEDDVEDADEAPPGKPLPSDPFGWGALEGNLQQRAADIRERILEHAADAEWKLEPDTAERNAAINRGFGIAFPDADERHAIRFYLLQKDSLAGYTRGESAMLVSWFDIKKDAAGHHVPSADCLEDAKTLLAAIAANETHPPFEHA